MRHYLCAYVPECTPHPLDLTAHLPRAPEPPAEGLARSRALPEKIAAAAFPPALSDKDALLTGTRRRALARAGEAALGALAARLPFVLGRPAPGGRTQRSCPSTGLV